MTQNPSKAIALCLHPDCPQPSRYVKQLNVKHNSMCSKYIFSIQQILSQDTIPSYPPTEIGQIVKKKLEETRKLHKEGYLDVILDDFKQTISKIMDRVRDQLNVIYPLTHLEKCYNEVYSLEPIRTLIKNQEGSALITEQLKLMSSNKKITRLIDTNSTFDNMTANLNQIINQLSEIMTNFKKNALQIKKDLADKTRDQFEKRFTSDQIIYKMTRTTYPEGKSIVFEAGWINFPSSNEDCFKPWVFSEKGFSTGVHKLKLIATTPRASKNCGVAIIKQSDINTYPYSIYKSFYDRVTREFKLVKGEEINKVTDEMLEIVLIMNLNDKKATLFDTSNKCQYTCSLKQSTVYYFGIAGANWRVKIMHLS